MLLAASESAVTKKPRLRLMIRFSSSDRPFGSFHRAMSRFMFTSCGIQWLAQVARYFSQAHLYLKGTSWLTSVWPLMMRLSAAETRRFVGAAGAAFIVRTGATAAGCAGARAASLKCAGGVETVANETSGEKDTSRFAFLYEPLGLVLGDVGVTS